MLVVPDAPFHVKTVNSFVGRFASCSERLLSLCLLGSIHPQRKMNTANIDTAAASEKQEAIKLQEKESRQACERQLAARQAMSETDKRKVAELGAQLQPYCICNLCKNILVEPWLVKDCGHLFCFRCLHSIVYELSLIHI